jgi:hypothetical protein
VTTTRPQAPAQVEAAAALADALVDAWGSWGPNMTPDARQVAFISDRSGVPQVYIQEVVLDGQQPGARPHPAVRRPGHEGAVGGRQRLADRRGGHRRRRPDGGVGGAARRVRRPPGGRGRRDPRELGPWTRSGHRFVVTFPGAAEGAPTRCYLADPATGRLDPLAEGDLIHVLDVSLEERFIVVRDGERGQQFVVVVDRLSDEDLSVLPHGATGSTDVALIRPAPVEHSGPVYVYLASDVGSRAAADRGPVRPNGWRGEPRTLRARDDAELEFVDADDAGLLLLLVWNVAGRSELELMDTATGGRTPITGPARPGRRRPGAQPRRLERGARRPGAHPPARAVAPGHDHARLDPRHLAPPLPAAAARRPRAGDLHRPGRAAADRLAVPGTGPAEGARTGGV